MKIIPLGVGNSFSTKFHNTSLLIDNRFLFDCGHTVPAQLRKYDKDALKELEGIFITHLHGDHIYGLEEVGFRSYFLNKRRIPLYVPEPIVHDLEGLLMMTMSALTGDNGGAVSAQGLGTFFDVIEMSGDTWVDVDHDGTRARFIGVDHVCNEPAYAVQLSDNETSVLYTGDISRPIFNFLDLNDTEVEPWSEYPEWQGKKYLFHDVAFGPSNIHCRLGALIGERSQARNAGADPVKDVSVYVIHFGDDIEEYSKSIHDAGFRIPVELQSVG